jgi:hypothetical protein
MIAAIKTYQHGWQAHMMTVTGLTKSTALCAASTLQSLNILYH